MDDVPEWRASVSLSAVHYVKSEWVQFSIRNSDELTQWSGTYNITNGFDFIFGQ